MKITLDSFFGDKNAPLYQSGALIIVVLVANLIGKMIQSTGISEWSELFPWIIAGSILLSFAFFNALIGLITTIGKVEYYQKSVIGFVILAIVAGLLAYLFSSLTIGEAGTMRWIYIVISIGYLIFMGIMMLMRTIVEIAQKEDENLRSNN
ncbi:MAG: hypothetical protein KJP00_05680 [Bacteroidia bacterium]|nr:hypothetical protein [Bacteroidia bacterium]